MYNENAILIDVLDSNEQRLLFVHQTENERRLMKRYGNELGLLDATYKTTRYTLPLFFLATKTNVDYQVIGSFIMQDETTQSILEGLSKLKEWNPEWNPKVMMVDYSQEEIDALHTLFPGNILNSKLDLLCIRNE